MNYKFDGAKFSGTGLPQTVTDKLKTANGDLIKVAVCIIHTGSAQLAGVCEAAGLSEVKVQKALDYWAGAGLLSMDNPEDADEERRVKTAKKTRKKLSHNEIARNAQRDPHVKTLAAECQALFGDVINEDDTELLLSLYLADGIDVDVIIMAVAHFTQNGKRSARYIEKQILSWQEQGITTAHDVERHLLYLERTAMHVKDVAKLFGEKESAFTATEKLQLAVWFEEYEYDILMIEQALMRANGNRTVKYVNGILRNWHAKGYKKPRDLKNEIANIVPQRKKSAKNIDGEQNGERAADAQSDKLKDIIKRKSLRVPKFKGGV